MVRPTKLRKFYIPHHSAIFTPSYPASDEKEIIVLNSDEYNAIRLIDYENHNHSQAARIMGVSRPTFTRIYDKARNKIATSLVELRKLKIQEGNSISSNKWYECNNCSSKFNIPDSEIFQNICPICKSSDIIKI